MKTHRIPAADIEKANALFQEAQDLTCQACDDSAAAARLQAASEAMLQAATEKREQASRLMCPTIFGRGD